ncbi:radical SAM domain protein [Clostridium sp. CAG:167]|jgi:putative DNA modification/repair radical SAM protein|nr:radical SAM domain protein [Clostridium sp. CAG:167]
MIFQEQASLREKLAILADAAKYDVACTSSGVDRRSRPGQLGNTAACGICHTFASDGRCISLLKILFTNECIHDCKYCLNRCSNDIPRATFTPEEVCTLTVEFYRRNYIEGLFLSSGIVQSADYTMEQICLTLKMLREEYHFNGYIHCKSIPGASPEWVEEAGWYADRMSVNLELPTAEGLRQLAPGKTRKTILTPMRQIQSGVAESRDLLGMKGGNQSAYWYTQKRLGRRLPSSDLTAALKGSSKKESISALSRSAGETSLATWRRRDTSRGFVPSGQSTQMIIGATGESDYEIMAVTEALYQNFDLKRVFYSAFINVNQDPAMTQASLTPPLRREHRLYQADFLLRFYGFQAKELLTEKRPFFNTYLDPKCDWALGHLEQFPVEITRADYQTLLRVPGIGTKSARRILQARRTGSISFSSLKTMGVVLKRAIYFITCHGKSAYPFMKIDEDYITRNLLADEPDVMKGYGSHVTYKQLTFEDFLTKQ